MKRIILILSLCFLLVACASGKETSTTQVAADATSQRTGLPSWAKEEIKTAQKVAAARAESERLAAEQKSREEAAAKAAHAKAAAAQRAKEAADRAARARATQKAAAPPTAAPVVSGDVWWRLALCESGGNAAANTGNGFYGAFQFMASTWRSVGGTGLPHQHSYEVQRSFAQKLQARSGWGQWPHCSRKLGLR